MRRREFLGCVGAGALGLCGCAPQRMTQAAATTGQKPNIIFILIDDMGYADLSCFGSPLNETPNLDRLAQSGTKFTQAYAACPVCSPTRASIVTGKYPARLKLTNFLKGTLSPKDSPVLTAPYADELPLEETTIAEILDDAGYVTGHIGKWHLGGSGFGPKEQGFNANVGGSQSGGVRSHFWPGWKGGFPVEGKVEGEYLADRLTDEACAFIERNREHPFFLYLCHFSVHIPLEAKADKIAKYEAKLKAHPAKPGEQNNALYAAMVESVDESVGRIVDAVRACGIDQNTILFFFSDNGGLSVKEGANTPATVNTPFRAGKGYVYEGGIREPLIVVWPGVTQPGTICETPVSSVDFLPTMCAMAGTEHGDSKVDGVDISAALRDPHATLDRDALYWHYPHFANQGGHPAGAVREGDWKLIKDYEFGKIELYNLRDDVGETHNLAETQPREAARLQKKLERWLKSVDANMPPPNPEYKSSAG